MIGLHYQKKKWGIHLNWWITSDVVDEDQLATDADAQTNFGTWMLERRF